jgi:hypothetical protein
MAKFVTFSPVLTITDEGTTVVDRSPSETRETEDYLEFSLRIANGAAKLVCAAGNEDGEVSPISIDLVELTGITLISDSQVQLTFDAASVAIKAGPGFLAISNTGFMTLKIENASGQVANLKLVIWGNRS